MLLPLIDRRPGILLPKLETVRLFMIGHMAPVNYHITIRPLAESGLEDMSHIRGINDLRIR